MAEIFLFCHPSHKKGVIMAVISKAQSGKHKVACKKCGKRVKAKNMNSHERKKCRFRQTRRQREAIARERAEANCREQELALLERRRREIAAKVAPRTPRSFSVSDYHPY